MPKKFKYIFQRVLQWDRFAKKFYVVVYMDELEELKKYLKELEKSIDEKM